MEDLEATVATYEAAADAYRERHRDRAAIAEARDRFLTSVDPDEGVVLDVGCGPGWETEAFAAAGHRSVGIDLSRRFLRMTRARPDTAALRADMRRLPVGSGTADGVWACASLLHVPRSDVDATLSGFRRVLSPGGTLWCSVKDGTGTTTGSTYANDGRRFVLHRPDTFADRVRAAGFAVDRLDTGDGWIGVLATADG